MADTNPTVEPGAADAAAAAAKAAADEAAAAIPAPPKGADFDTIATMHNQLLAESAEKAAAFHKKYVVNFKSK